jgi:hypothetical protein
VADGQRDDILGEKLSNKLLQSVHEMKMRKAEATPPVPVGRVYHSGCSDVSTQAGSLLFESSAEALLKRRNV